MDSVELGFIFEVVFVTGVVKLGFSQKFEQVIAAECYHSNKKKSNFT